MIFRYSIRAAPEIIRLWIKSKENRAACTAQGKWTLGYLPYRSVYFVPEVWLGWRALDFFILNRMNLFESIKALKINTTSSLFSLRFESSQPCAVWDFLAIVIS